MSQRSSNNGDGDGDKHTSSFASLSDILTNSIANKRTTRNSIRAANAAGSLLPTLEDLKQKLEGNHDDDSCTKLNLSRAFGGLPSSFRFESNLNNNNNDGESSSSLLSSTILNNNHQEQSFNVISNNLNIGRQKRSQQLKQQREQRGHQSIKIETDEIINDTEREITQIIKQIETKEHFKNFKNENIDDDDDDDDDDHKDRINQLFTEFNLIQLPIDFNLDDGGQINVYQSGIIEIVSGGGGDDQSPIKFRMRYAKKNSNKPLKTDLLFTTEHQVIIERMNVCVPETLPN